jgi:hypothetical protein
MTNKDNDKLLELASMSCEAIESRLANLNPLSFRKKPKLSPKQNKARKASKQAKKSRKTNRRK